MTEVAVQLIAHGRVQGVGFRYSVYQLAIRHHLTGSVHNNADGTVTVIAQGSPSMVAELTEAVRKSPNSWANVTQLEVSDVPVQPRKSFDIY